MRRPPGRPTRTPQPTRLPTPATVFDVGTHAVRVWVENERWVVSVDGVRLDRWYETQADAWMAGVGEADRASRGNAGPRAVSDGKAR